MKSFFIKLTCIYFSIAATTKKSVCSKPAPLASDHPTSDMITVDERKHPNNQSDSCTLSNPPARELLSPVYSPKKTARPINLSLTNDTSGTASESETFKQSPALSEDQGEGPTSREVGGCTPTEVEPLLLGARMPTCSSPGIVPESPTSPSGLNVRFNLPALAMFVKRSEHNQVPYLASETPPCGREIPSKQSSSLPNLSLLNDVVFRLSSCVTHRHLKSKQKLPSGICRRTRSSTVFSREPESSTELNSTSVFETLLKEKVSAPQSCFPSTFDESRSTSTSTSLSMRKTKSDETVQPNKRPTRPSQCSTAMSSKLVRSIANTTDAVHLEKSFNDDQKSGAETSRAGNAMATRSDESGCVRESSQVLSDSLSSSASKPCAASSTKASLLKKSKSVPPDVVVSLANTSTSKCKTMLVKAGASPTKINVLKKSESPSPIPTSPKKQTTAEPDKHEKSKQSTSISEARAPKATSRGTVDLKRKKSTLDLEEEQAPSKLKSSPLQSVSGHAVHVSNSSPVKHTNEMRKEKRPHSNKNEDTPVLKRTNLESGKISDNARRSPSCNLTPRHGGSRSPVKPVGSPRKEMSSSRSRSRGSPSGYSSEWEKERLGLSTETRREKQCYSTDRERDRQSGISALSERELLRHHADWNRLASWRPYHRSRDSSPVHYGGSPPPLLDSERYCSSPRPPCDAWHRHSPPIMDALPHHPSSPHLGYAPLLPNPHYAPPPPPHSIHHHQAPLHMPYGPPPHGWHPYDQRGNRFNSDLRYGRYVLPPQDWYYTYGDTFDNYM